MSEKNVLCFQRFLIGGSVDVGKFVDCLCGAGFICPFRYPWGVSTLVVGLSAYMTTCLVVFFLGGLSFPSVPCYDRVSKISVGTALIRPKEFSPLLLRLVVEKVSTG